MPFEHSYPVIKIGEVTLEPIECLFYYDGVVMFFSAKDADGNHYLAVSPDVNFDYRVARVSPGDIARMKNREVPIATLFNESPSKWTVQVDENGVAAAVPVDAFDPLDLPDADALY